MIQIITGNYEKNGEKKKKKSNTLTPKISAQQTYNMSTKRGIRLKRELCWAVMACFVGALLLCEARATDESAREKYDEAVSQYQKNNYFTQQWAFTQLYDAYYEAESKSLENTIEKQITKTYKRYLSLITEQLPCFLDTPKAEEEHMYDRLAQYGDARGNRLKGLLLLERNDNSGINYLYKADKKGDPMAAAEISKSYAYGLHGCKKDAKLAWDWLQRGVSLGGLNAYEIMSRVLWDGDGNWVSEGNASESVKYAEKVLAEYKRWKLGNEEKEKDRQNLCSIYESMLTIMRGWRDFPGLIRESGGYDNFEPTKFQIECAFLSEESIKYFLENINEDFKIYGGSYGTPPGSKVDIGKLKLVVGGSRSNSLGRTNTRCKNSTVANRIEIFYDSLPTNRNTSQSFWYRRMVLMDTLAHELAHVYFSQRYPNIDSVSDLDSKRLYEGHATNVAYQYINIKFFRCRLSPESYANIFLSNEYEKYFFWFRNNCLWPSELVQWDKIDRWERDASGEEGVYTRTQVRWEDDDD